eukprot:134765-Chlamydomonas_euryale.AAC.1
MCVRAGEASVAGPIARVWQGPLHECGWAHSTSVAGLKARVWLGSWHECDGASPGTTGQGTNSPTGVDPLQHQRPH